MSRPTEAELTCTDDDCGSVFTVDAIEDTGWIELQEEPVCPDCGTEVAE